MKKKKNTNSESTKIDNLPGAEDFKDLRLKTKGVLGVAQSIISAGPVVSVFGMAFVAAAYIAGAVASHGSVIATIASTLIALTILVTAIVHAKWYLKNKDEKEDSSPKSKTIQSGATTEGL